MSKADIEQEIETLRHILNGQQRNNAQILELSQELDRYIVLFYLIDRGV
jgi:hypothetical protein